MLCLLVVYQKLFTLTSIETIATGVVATTIRKGYCRITTKYACIKAVDTLLDTMQNVVPVL